MSKHHAVKSMKKHDFSANLNQDQLSCQKCTSFEVFIDGTIFEMNPSTVIAVTLFHTQFMDFPGNCISSDSQQNGGIVLPDIREGETIITEMWFLIEELKAKRDGRVFDRETASVPPIFDYRQCETKYRRPARRRGGAAEKSAENK